MVTKLKYVTKSGVIIHAEVNDFAAIILFRTLSQRKNSPKFNIPKPSYKIRKIDFCCCSSYSFSSWPYNQRACYS